MAITVESLCLQLGARRVLEDLSGTWRTGLVGLLGPNGAGKSSFLRVLSGLWQPTSGTVLLNGQPLSGIGVSVRAKQMSFLPSARDMTWPLPVRDVVALGRYPHRGPFAPWTQGDQAAVDAALDAVDAAHLADRALSGISNGERARVLLARALAVEAPVLLVDEAVAALDPAHQLQVMDVLKGEADKGRLVIAVLHDLGLARRYCDELVLVSQGRFAEQGSPEAVLTKSNLSEVFGIDARIGTDQGQPFIIPTGRVRGRESS